MAIDAQTRTELADLLTTRITDALLAQNTAAGLREVVGALIDSAFIRATDVLGYRDIAGLPLLLARKADLSSTTGLVVPTQLPVPTFAGLADHPFANPALFGLLFPLLNGGAVYHVVTYAAAVDAASDGQLDPGHLYRITSRPSDGALDIVVPAAGTTGFSAEEAYTVGAGSDDPPFLPVTYDLATDEATERGAGASPAPAGLAATYLGDPANNNVQIGNGAGNSIGAGCTNCQVAGEGNSIIDGPFHSIDASSAANEIQGGYYIAIIASKSCTVPATCQRVVLINCFAFTVPGSASDVTYVNNRAI